MQIGKNYDPYSNYNYLEHTHHITECVQEKQRLKKPGGDGGSMGTVQRSKQSDLMDEEERSVDIFLQEKAAAGRKKQGIFGSIRETLGKTDQGEKHVFHRGIDAALSMVKQGFSAHIVNKWEPVKEKIKVGIHTALKRFGRDSHPFGTLTDQSTGFLTDSRTGRESAKERKQQGTRKQNAVVEVDLRGEDHLLDSYSKSGQYCKINENLTYQSRKNPSGFYSQTEQEKQKDSF